MKNARDVLIEELRNLYEQSHGGWEPIADFILADRKRIVKPLAKEDMSKYDCAPFEAIRKTLLNAGVL